MSIIPAQTPFVGLKVTEPRVARRWPRAVGLGLAALASAGLWVWLIIAVRYFI
ncbi:hypothetical protein [Caulobacter sp.]|uniref:hypothetical protein n=1 Tax=Caulobacter sp. TaxID=78 RepID=UPI003BB1D43B